ncbi:MAG TPA: DUF3108 domain-containing protein [Gemmatimonadaceae bacterium]|nr:DUF3108 domain-containing protein [Gemmatimonadaceae bacterium]
MTNISRLLSVAVALGVHHAPLRAQAPAPAPIRSAAMPVPFEVGERLDYDVKFGPMHVGSGSMEVLGNENVRNRPTWHIMFRVKGGTFFYKVDDRFESWMETTTLSSLRHKQDINEGRRDRERVFEIYPERPSYIEDDKPEKPSVDQPLDDGSFLYFIRTVPLEVGKTYEFDRYFRPDRNPVKITVLRKERIKVPAGTFDAIVIRPSIKSKGIFSENGQAEVWLSDDDRHIMLQMKSKLSFGSLNLYLKSYRPPPSQAQ